MEWKKDYSVKVEEIDKQHQKLFSFMDVVKEAIKNEGLDMEKEEVQEVLTEEQHKELFSKIDNISKTIRAGGKDLRKSLEKILLEMTDYAVYHFNTEEKYFHKFNYPETDEHIRYHESYKVKVKEFQAKLRDVDEENLAELGYKILAFIQEWWVGHILHVDMKYSIFFNKHGLE